MDDTLEKANIFVAMSNGADVEKIKALRKTLSLRDLYFLCCGSEYSYASELLEAYSEEAPKEVLQYRISLGMENLLDEYKKEYGEDEFYHRYAVFSKEVSE